MAGLSPASVAAIARLRAFRPPPTNYFKLPLTRRAAVLILLFADRKGELRVVLTIRSAKLRNYAGQAALPGGKADTETETPWQTSRREAEEEIGLSADGARPPSSPSTSSTPPPSLPPNYKVDYLTSLPCNLAMTELSVCPVLAFLSSPPDSDPTKDLLPSLQANEVAALFTAPFEQFLAARDNDEAEGEWYKGAWHSWYHEPWRMHMFHVPVSKKTVFRSKDEEDLRLDAGIAPMSPKAKAPVLLADRLAAAVGDRDADTEERKKREEDKKKKEVQENALNEPRYRVFGMTARILVDAARVAYGRDPEFEHNSSFGDEKMIERLMKIGRLGPKKEKGEILTRDVMQQAAKVEIPEDEGKGKL